MLTLGFDDERRQQKVFGIRRSVDLAGLCNTAFGGRDISRDIDNGITSRGGRKGTDMLAGAVVVMDSDNRNIERDALDMINQYGNAASRIARIRARLQKTV